MVWEAACLTEINRALDMSYVIGWFCSPVGNDVLLVMAVEYIDESTDQEFVIYLVSFST